MTLFEIKDQFLTLLDMETDIDADVFADTMDSIEAELEDKADAYAAILKEFDGRIMTAKAEINRLRFLVQTLEDRGRIMKENLTAVMIQTDRRKFKTALNSFSVQANPPSVRIDCPIESLPEKYIKYRDPEPDKAKLKAALRLGEEIPGVSLVVSEGVRIR